MKKIISYLSAIIILFFIGLSVTHAFDMPFGQPSGTIMPPESDFSGTSDTGTRIIAGGVMKIVSYLRILMGAGATVWLVWAGVKFTTANGEDEQIERSKKSITWALISLSVVLLVEPLIKDTFYGGGSNLTPAGLTANAETMRTAVSAGSMQIFALIEWFKAIVVVLALAYLVLSGWRMTQSFGEEESITKNRNVILWIAVGFGVIALNEVVVNEVVYKVALGDNWRVNFSQDAVRGIAELVGLIKYVLRFAAIGGIVSLIYGGILMITAFSNDENTEKAKKIISGSLIGLFIVLISFALTSTLISGQT